MDLKEYGDGRYILYVIDMFTRFTVGVFINNKKAETVSEALLRKWISVFGVMEMLMVEKSLTMRSCQQLLDI